MHATYQAIERAPAPPAVRGVNDLFNNPFDAWSSHVGDFRLRVQRANEDVLPDVSRRLRISEQLVRFEKALLLNDGFNGPFNGRDAHARRSARRLGARKLRCRRANETHFAGETTMRSTHLTLATVLMCSSLAACDGTDDMQDINLDPATHDEAALSLSQLQQRETGDPKHPRPG